VRVTDSFAEVKALDNFYQTSSFFPMPVVLVSSLTGSGATSLGPYSLCFPHIVAGRHSMMLIARDTSNTARNIQERKHCALNFIPHRRRYMRNCVTLGFPGETPEEKMKNSIFSLEPSRRVPVDGSRFPEIVREAVQVFECTWDDSFPLTYVEGEQERRFVLRIEKIHLKPRLRDALLRGRCSPDLPVDYGFRDNARFWIAGHRRPYPELIPRSKGVTVDAVKYAVQRVDPDVKWQEEACAKLVRVPRPFMTMAIRACVEAAEKEGVTEITAEFVDRVRDKRSGEKGR
jgi:flavin reductase (DIM6/NTAB) family NADH-FMN oxidoreductase RutF